MPENHMGPGFFLRNDVDHLARYNITIIFIATVKMLKYVHRN